MGALKTLHNQDHSSFRRHKMTRIFFFQDMTRVSRSWVFQPCTELDTVLARKSTQMSKKVCGVIVCPSGRPCCCNKSYQSLSGTLHSYSCGMCFCALLCAIFPLLVIHSVHVLFVESSVGIFISSVFSRSCTACMSFLLCAVSCPVCRVQYACLCCCVQCACPSLSCAVCMSFIIVCSVHILLAVCSVYVCNCCVRCACS